MLKKSLILSFCLFFVAVNVAFADEPADRNCYAVFAESLTGVHWDADSSDIDAMYYEVWQGVQSNPDRTDTPKEGNRYFKFIWTVSSGWTGLGFSCNKTKYRDMSHYMGGNIKFYARSSNSKVLNCKVGIILDVDGVETKCYKTLGELGFKANGSWEDLSFPLNSSNNSKIKSENLKKMKYFFYMSQDSNLEAGNSIDIDFIRYVKSSTTKAAFNVNLYSVSDKNKQQKLSSKEITWSADTFRNINDEWDYAIAEQFLEVDYDNDTYNNWDVKLYVNNGSSDRNGLYGTTKSGQDVVLPMCWRASEKTLPYTDGYGSHTVKIGETQDASEEYYLYDKGNGNRDFRPWLYMQDLKALKTDKDKDYSTIMNSKNGYHGYSGEYGSSSNSGYYSGSLVNVYFGADCRKALGGLKYTGNICVVLTYE